VVSRRELTGGVRRVRHWWSEELWAVTAITPQMPRLERLGVHIARTLYIVMTGFRTERIKLRAALLTYVSMLSLVPALVVMFSVFAAFAGLRDVRDALKRYVISSMAVSSHDVVIRYLDSFVESAGTIGSVGVLILFITVIALIGNIERALNDVWGLRRGRTWFQKFQVYWPLVTLGPVLLGLSLSLTGALETSETVKRLVILTPIFNVVFKVLPVVFTWVFLTLVYVLLPNTHVPLRAALIGGVIAGTLWEGAKLLYALYASFTLSVPSVYGSLAAVPLFVLWIYVSWVIALLGATLTFAIQNARTYEPETEKTQRKSQRDRELLAARLLIAASASFERGLGPVPSQALLDEIIVSPRFARRVLQELVEAGLLVETIKGDDTAYVPGRPLHAISIADVVHAMRRGAPESKTEVMLAAEDQLGQRVCKAILEAEKAVDATLGNMTLAALLAETRSSGPGPGL
jgi:membrane protein